MKIIHDLSGIADPMTLARLAANYLEGTIAHNRYLIRCGNGIVPPVLDSGVVFRDEPWAGGALRDILGRPSPCLEEFCHLGIVLGRGWGDCAQICAWRIAELREQGNQAGLRIYCRPQPDKRRFFHVQTRHAPVPRFKNDPKAGPIEDTSRILKVV
jgi:hypothetical protein